MPHPPGREKRYRDDVGFKAKGMLEASHIFNPWFWAPRAGLIPVLALVPLGVLIITTVWVLLRKSHSGADLVFPLARVQFLIAMIVITVHLHYAFWGMSTWSPSWSIRMGMWTINMIYAAVTCLIHLGLIASCLAATMARFNRRLALTPMDILAGLSAVASVGLNVLAETIGMWNRMI